MGILSNKAGSHIALKTLYRYVAMYFKAENSFRANPCDDTWKARQDCDRKLTREFAEFMIDEGHCDAWQLGMEDYEDEEED